MLTRKLSAVIFSAALLLSMTSFALEAKTNISFNLGALLTPPQPRVYETYVVERSRPAYYEPVYLVPGPAYPTPVVYVAPRVHREVVVYQQRPVVRSGFSFSWNNCRHR